MEPGTSYKLVLILSLENSESMDLEKMVETRMNLGGFDLISVATELVLGINIAKDLEWNWEGLKRFLVRTVHCAMYICVHQILHFIPKIPKKRVVLFQYLNITNFLRVAIHFHDYTYRLY